jgi:cobalt/nickel transport system ATP-binding protein
MAPAFRLDAVRYVYPDGQLALDGVDLTIDVGERVAVLGPNGSGKTTLVLHLNGILEPTSGSVAVGDLPATTENIREIRRRVGVVFQDPDDQLFMPTVYEDVAFGPANFGVRDGDLAAAVDDALATVGLREHGGRVPHHLSQGERRRAAIATVLAMDPKVLVLDEPTANLDPAGRRDLSDVLDRLDMTLLVVTHDLPYALELCPRAVILDRGRVVADGPTIELLSDAALLAAHRLELPRGYQPHRVAR